MFVNHLYFFVNSLCELTPTKSARQPGLRDVKVKEMSDEKTETESTDRFGRSVWSSQNC